MYKRLLHYMKQKQVDLAMSPTEGGGHVSRRLCMSVKELNVWIGPLDLYFTFLLFGRFES